MPMFPSYPGTLPMPTSSRGVSSDVPPLRVGRGVAGRQGEERAGQAGPGEGAGQGGAGLGAAQLV